MYGDRLHKLSKYNLNMISHKLTKWSRFIHNSCRLHEITFRICDIGYVHQYHGSHRHRLAATYRKPLWQHHNDGLVQERRNSSALSMELRLSCTNPSILFRNIKLNIFDKFWSRRRIPSPNYHDLSLGLSSVIFHFKNKLELKVNQCSTNGCIHISVFVSSHYREPPVVVSWILMCVCVCCVSLSMEFEGMRCEL